MEERPGSAWFGLPAMLAVAVLIAVFSATNSILAVVLSILGVIILLLAIGFAMTIAKRS